MRRRVVRRLREVAGDVRVFGESGAMNLTRSQFLANALDQVAEAIEDGTLALQPLRIGAKGVRLK